MTSRDSHEVRHRVAVRQALSGWPRWKKEAISPGHGEFDFLILRHDAHLMGLAADGVCRNKTMCVPIISLKSHLSLSGCILQFTRPALPDAHSSAPCAFKLHLFGSFYPSTKALIDFVI